MPGIFENCQFINEGLLDRFKKPKIANKVPKAESITHTEYMQMLDNMQSIFNELTKVLQAIQSEYKQYFVDHIKYGKEDIRHWRRRANSNQPMQPLIECALESTYDDYLGDDILNDMNERFVSTIKNLGFELDDYYTDEENGLFGRLDTLSNEQYPYISILVKHDYRYNYIYIEVYCTSRIIIK